MLLLTRAARMFLSRSEYPRGGLDDRRGQRVAVQPVVAWLQETVAGVVFRKPSSSAEAAYGVVVPCVRPVPQIPEYSKP